MAEPLDSARVPVHRVGYCVVCDRMVKRAEDNACPAGHPAEAVSGSLLLFGEEPVPQLPRINWAALAMPVLWGPAHGQWVGAIFLPLWIFADGAIASAGAGVSAALAALVILGVTIWFQVFFARRANGLAWRRVCDAMTVREFSALQRKWALVCVPLGSAVVVWGTYYRITHL